MTEDQPPPKRTINDELRAQIRETLDKIESPDSFEKKFLTDMSGWRFPTEKQWTILQRILDKYAKQPDPIAADDAF